MKSIISTDLSLFVISRKETAAVNWERKSVQTAIGSKLRGLEQAWVQLVSHNYSLERAIAELENELTEAQTKSKEDSRRDTQVIKNIPTVLTIIYTQQIPGYKFFDTETVRSDPVSAAAYLLEPYYFDSNPISLIKFSRVVIRYRAMSPGSTIYLPRIDYPKLANYFHTLHITF